MIPTKRANQHARAGRNAYPRVRSWLPLTDQQKAAVCMLARQSFEHMHGRGPTSQKEFDGWRREQQQKAIGEASLTLAKQSDMPRLKAHFLDLKGESGRAFRELMKPEVSDTAQARAVLARNLREKGLTQAYAAAICQRKNKCGLDEATPKQLWQLVFTIKNAQPRSARQTPAATEDEAAEASENPF